MLGCVFHVAFESLEFEARGSVCLNVELVIYVCFYDSITQETWSCDGCDIVYAVQQKLTYDMDHSVSGSPIIQGAALFT